ncbi:MAG: hypothetical protein K6G27_04970 [Lachnospiraceae bacterium]|nr:hypothetical protein [Lachnospiraceae bacterium]
MKLIDLTCPKCGASIKADPSKETYTCEYCNSVLFIDKETEKANENPHGSKEEKPKTEQDPMAKEREELCSRLLNARIFLNSAEKRYDEYEKAKKQYESIGNASKIVTLGGGFLVGCMLVVPIVSILGRIISPRVLLIAIWIICPIYFYRMNIKKQHVKVELKEQAKALFQQYADNMGRLSGDLDVIPSEYRYSDAINGIYEHVRSGETLDINEAAALYRTETERLKTENPVEAKARETQKQEYIKRQQSLARYNNGNMEF